MEKSIQAGVSPVAVSSIGSELMPHNDVTNPVGDGVAPKGDRTWLAAVVGALAAVGAATCCVVPLVLFTLGISGAWISNLTSLAPYQPIFVAFAAAALLYGFFKVYRQPAKACDDGTYCAAPSSTRVLKVALWATTFLVMAALLFPYIAAQFLEA